jgi:hypothetical protein
MSTIPQAAIVAGQAELCPEIAVRNLVVDYLLQECKWCGEVIIDSSTKRRKFCNNGNVCCNAYSRDKKRREQGFKHSQFWGPWIYQHDTIVRGQGDLFAVSEVIFKSTPKRVPSDKPKYFGGGVCTADGSLAVTPRSVKHEVDANNRPTIKEPTPVAFERHALIGPRRQIEGKATKRRGSRGKRGTNQQLVKDSRWVDQLAR